jgi:ankyrin repeat protein
VKLLLENGAEVNAQGGRYRNALHTAAESHHQGNEMIMKLLLENGADVNAKGGEYGNALQTASFKGNEAAA